jgi:hypothetical protein
MKPHADVTVKHSLGSGNPDRYGGCEYGYSIPENTEQCLLRTNHQTGNEIVIEKTT